MQKPKLVLLWISVVVSGITLGLLLGSCFSAPINLQLVSPLDVRANQQVGMSDSVVKAVRSEKLYLSYSFEEMTNLADAIFVGKITAISPVQWNQDSGEYWVAEPGDLMFATPLRYITADVMRPIVESEALDKLLKITTMTDFVLLNEKNEVVNQEEMEQGLQVGNQVVMFIRKTNLVWRGGVRPATMLMGMPSQSYFKLGEDGLYHGPLLKEPLDLETLIQKILDQRASPTPAP